MNYSRGFITPLVVIIVAVLLMGGGAYWVSNSKNTGLQWNGFPNLLGLATSTPNIQNPAWLAADPITVENTRGGFSFKVPEEFEKLVQTAQERNFSLENGIENIISIGEKFNNAIGITSTSTTRWTVTSGFAGRNCAIVNDGLRYTGTSTDVIAAGGVTFYKVSENDGCGAGSCGNSFRYVQPLNGNTCRFINFSHMQSNGYGAFEWTPEEKKQVSANDSAINAAIEKLIPEIISTIGISTNSQADGVHQPIIQEINHSINYRVSGYYTSYTQNYFGDPKQCDALVVTGGDPPFISYFSDKVTAGNTVNRLTPAGQLVFTLNLDETSQDIKTYIKESNATSRINLTINVPEQEGRGAPPCFSFGKIVMPVVSP